MASILIKTALGAVVLAIFFGFAPVRGLRSGLIAIAAAIALAFALHFVAL
jgi:hypothetical protein